MTTWILINKKFAKIAAFDKNNQDFPDTNLSEKGEYDMSNILTVTSPAFENEAVIPIQYTGRGEDISPELHLSAIDGRAKSLAVIMDDMNHPIPAYNHWIIWNIPVMETIPENIAYGADVAELGGAVQGRGYGKNRYRGPKPPFNWRHLYQFNVYALDCLLDLSPRARKRNLIAAMQGHILQKGALTGYFQSHR